ncbi:MAG: hypothetical protein DI538_08035 [Azospira oryzae]|jgi:hypothetical protein|nr:MAG: hypothetical protein DI538_08035 [Azospira oryzae]
MNISKVINQISVIPVFITVIYSIYIYKSLGKELKSFSWFLIISGIIQFISSALWYARTNNLPLLHIYVAVGFFLIAYFYIQVLDEFINKKIIWIILLLFLTFSVLNSIFIQPILTFASYSLTVESILIIILSLSTYIMLLDDIVRDKLKGLSKSLNWINSGLFIYYSSNLLIFYFGDTITHTFSKEISRYTWVLHSFFSVIMYCCFFVGLWYRPKN